jgi:hypothetical protein
MMATQRDNSRSDLSPRKVAERLKEEGKSRLERGKSTAADQVDQFANAIKSAGGELNGSPTLASYANELATSISNFGTRLRDGSIEDLAYDMQQAARRNPTMFIAGGLALGIVLARLVKASTTEEEPLLVGSDYDESLASSGTTSGATSYGSSSGTTGSGSYGGSTSSGSYSGTQSSDAPTVDVSSETYGAGTTGSGGSRNNFGG